MPMTTIPTLREALAKAISTARAATSRAAVLFYISSTPAETLAKVRAEEVAAWAAVDQAVEALAGPDAGEEPRLTAAEGAATLLRVGQTMRHALTFIDSKERMHPDGVKLYRIDLACLESLAEDFAASTPQPEPAAGGWRDIASAPKDGTRVWAKRVYEDRTIKEGWAVFGLLDDAAPARQPMPPDPLNRLTPLDYAGESEARTAWVESPRWLNEDRLYAFPEPTHWLPAPPSAASPSPPGLDEGGVEAAAKQWMDCISSSPPQAVSVDAVVRSIITAYLEATHGR